MKTTTIIGYVLATIVIVLLGIVIFSPRILEDSGILLEGRGGGDVPESLVYYDTSSSNAMVHSGAAILERIIVGKNEGTASITFTDSDSTTLFTEPFFSISGGALRGVYEIGLDVDNGIYVAVSSSTNTIIYRPK